MEEERVKEETRLLTFEAVSKFKSVNRAMRRGHISTIGIIYPRRPFNNRSNKNNTRPINELRKKIYGELRSQSARV